MTFHPRLCQAGSLIKKIYNSLMTIIDNLKWLIVDIRLLGQQYIESGVSL